MNPLPHLVLPVQTYMETDEQSRMALEARLLIIDDCLKAEDVTFRPTPATRTNLPSLMAGRYGPVNETQAAYGYHFMVAIGGTEKRRVENPPADARKAMSECSGEAVERIPSLKDQGIPDVIKQTSFVGATKIPDVVQAFGRWSACMSAAGYSYKSPMDAMRDTRWDWQSASASKKEIAVAERDVECKQRSGVVNAWFEGEVGIQLEEIKHRKGDLQSIRSQIEKREEVSRKLLKDHTA